MTRAMKDSGVPWIGEIPATWEYSRLKDYYDFEKGKNAALYTQEYLGEHKGIYPVYSGQTENNGVMGFIDSYDYNIGECLFTTTVGAKVMTPKILNGKFSLSQNCLIMKPKRECSNQFFYYSLLPLFEYTKSLIPTYMQPSLRVSDLNRFGIYTPCLKEQQRIADFLDAKCARIDAVIEQTRASIEEYKKLKQAIITRAVTKGLRPDRPMKDSGIEWIGEIPEDWQLSKIKYFYTCYDGKRVPVDSGERRSGPYPYWGAGSITDYVDDYLFDEELVLLGEDGAPFFDHTRPVAFLINEKVWINNHIHVLKPKPTISSKFLVYWLNNVEYRTYINGSILNKLTQSNMNNIAFAVPHLAEQQLIAEYLDDKCASIDSVIEQKTNLIEELESYKKSLIFEYVTGKKEVL